MGRPESLISESDTMSIVAGISRINAARKIGIKAKEVIDVSCGTATIYHLGANNPTIRIDIKVWEEQ